MTITVFLLEDHDQVRAGLRRVIDAEDDLRVVGEAATVGEALDQVMSSCPDVAILDVELPDGNGVEVGRDIRSYCPGVKCIMLTGIMDDEALIAAAIAGADGFLPKPASAASVLDAIRQVASGHQLVEPALVSTVTERLRHGPVEDPLLAGLDPHERRVLHLVADGHTNRQIGENLDLPEHSVKTHISDALAKLGIVRRGFTSV
jgi:DNA-binding NarL/FixJ family response regulator